MIELKPWRLTSKEAPDYNSTKANFDELDERIVGQDERLSSHSRMEGDLRADIYRRLTALEAKEPLSITTGMNGRVTVFVDSKKVDVPEKAADEVIWTYDERGWQWHRRAKR